MATPAQITNPLRQTFLQEAIKEAKAQLQDVAKEAHLPPTEEEFESYFAMAIFAYQAESATNISLSEGDILVILEESEGWVKAVRGEEIGWVPGNYLEKIAQKDLPFEEKFEEDLEEEMRSLEITKEKNKKELEGLKAKIVDSQEQNITHWAKTQTDLKRVMGTAYYGVTPHQELSYDVHYLIEAMEHELNTHGKLHTLNTTFFEATDSLIARIGAIPALKKYKTKLEGLCKELKAKLEKPSPAITIDEECYNTLVELAQRLDADAI